MRSFCTAQSNGMGTPVGANASTACLPSGTLTLANVTPAAASSFGFSLAQLPNVR